MPRASAPPHNSTSLPALAVFCSALLIKSYTYLMGNQALQIPFVQIIRDPSLYPDDPFVETLGNYCSFFWLGVAHLPFIPLPVLLFVIFLLTTAGGVWAAARVAAGFFPDSRIAPWAGAIVFALGLSPFLGYGTIAAPCAEQTSLTVVLLLLAFAACLRDRPYWWAICFGLAFDLNAMYGTHVFLYFALLALVLLVRRQLDRRWLYAVLLFFLLISPSVVWSLQTLNSLQPSSPAASAAWYQAAQPLYSFHLFPMKWAGFSFLQHGVLLLAVVVVLQSNTPQNQRAKPLVWAALAASTIWLALAFINAYIIRTPAAISTHAGRGLDLFHALSAIYLVAFFSRYFEENRWPSRRARIGLAGILCTILLFSASDVALPVLVLLAVAALVTPRGRRALRNLDAATLRATLCVGLVAIAIATAGVRVAQGKPWFYGVGPDAQLRQAADWAAHNTRGDDTFLLDPFAPFAQFFRPLTRRPVFTTWKDGSAIMWDTGYAATFTARLRDLGVDIATVDRSSDAMRAFSGIYATLTDDHIRNLAGKRRLTYALFDAKRDTNLPIVYANSKYKIAALTSSPRSNPVSTPPAPTDHR